MSDYIAPKDFLKAEGVEDWRLISEGACAFFRTVSFADSAKLVQALRELAGVEDHPPAVDVRQGGVTVRLITDEGEYFGPSQRDLDLARKISATSQDLGLSADPRPHRAS